MSQPESSKYNDSIHSIHLHVEESQNSQLQSGHSSYVRIDSKRRGMELPLHIKDALNRKAKLMERLQNNAIYNQTQCMSKQSKFYNSLGRPYNNNPSEQQFISV